MTQHRHLRRTARTNEGQPLLQQLIHVLHVGHLSEAFLSISTKTLAAWWTYLARIVYIFAIGIIEH